ncbi:nitrite reductase large subunit NirB [Isoptericola aurantiacus]|uniref:nitrite reductase large subunit NirB n=1 Tax=Isoptericola aurantiacus TaxID=3377839 RepID=UPI00383ACE94
MSSEPPTSARPDARRHVVVVGGGMVAQRFVEALRARDTAGEWRVSLFAEEPRKPYDRVGLTRYFEVRDAEELTLGDPALWDDPLVTLHRDCKVVSIDREARTVTDRLGRVHAYDELVLATGSNAARPPIPGNELPGVFVYRTIDDVAELRGWVESKREANKVTTRGGVVEKPVRGAVIGGGLLGLEAAGALKALGAQATVIEFGTHLMGVQVDLGGGQALKRLINDKGIAVRAETATKEMRPHRRTGHVGRMDFADGGRLDVDVVVMATGVRPRDELAREAGLPIGERGGAVVDLSCRTEDPHVWAIGEVACIEGRCLGLVAPGNTMAEVVVDQLLGGAAVFPGADTATKLKLSGVDVASFGDAHGRTEDCIEIVWADPTAGVYKKLVLSDDASTLLGGVFVGDAAPYASLRPMLGAELPGDPAAFLLPEGGGAPDLELPDEANVCSCNNVSAGTIRGAVTEHDCTSVGDVKSCTRAGTTCGACLPLVKKITETEMTRAGIEVSNALCEHFAMTRAQLFDAVRVAGLHSFSEIIERFGVVPEGATSAGRGCDICKPVVASVLASLGNGHILAGEQSTLQDTNDHMLANMQKDGTYSVVPRVPGGEITPEGLIVIGEVAKDFGLYTKITGGQRIDMFGARVEQLPDIWKRLVDAGFESGHAYGKSLRTVKSCVGSTWCRYGVQDSVGMAVELELRYRGLRSPHKLKLGVSGCARECAEARGKDVGVIATDKGWNLYVAGNGGQTPKHAQLLAEDLDSATLLRTIDRFLMFYIRTADRLQRTAPWAEEYEGGLEAIRQVIMEDSLGIADDLDAAMAAHVGAYEDEWKAVLEDPEKLARFGSFVNAPTTPDPALAYVPERGQKRPATPDEIAAGTAEPALAGPVLVAGPTLEVRA